MINVVSNLYLMEFLDSFSWFERNSVLNRHASVAERKNIDMSVLKFLKLFPKTKFL